MKTLSPIVALIAWLNFCPSTWAQPDVIVRDRLYGFTRIGDPRTDKKGLADLLEQVRRQTVKETWRLETQNIGWPGFADADMKDLAQLKGLANVWIHKAAHEQRSDFEVTATGWSQLRQLPKLRWLGIGDMNDAVAFDDDSFAEIAKLTELETLYLNCKGSAKGVKKLLGLKHLAGFGLNVNGAGADDTLVKELVAAMPDLESLTISYSTISDQGMKELAKLKRLSHLAIGSNHVTDAGLQEVARMKKAAVVNIASNKITEDGKDRLWEARPDLFMLNGVGVHHGPDSLWTMQVDFFHSAQAMPIALSEKEFAKLSENPALKRLGVGWPGMSASDMKNVSRCQRLSHLLVTQNIQFGPNGQRLEVKLNADAWKPLNELPRLQMLVVHDIVLDADALAAIGKCKELRTLRLVKSKASDAGALQLSGLEKLTGLELSGSEITGAGLEKFGRFKNLRYLSLNGSKITDDGLKHLSGLPHLLHLDLASTKVSDAGLKHLVGMKSLQSVNLIGTSISDAGLKTLAEIKSLKGAYVTTDRVTEQGVQWLRQARPDMILSPPVFKGL